MSTTDKYGSRLIIVRLKLLSGSVVHKWDRSWYAISLWLNVASSNPGGTEFFFFVVHFFPFLDFCFVFFCFLSFLSHLVRTSIKYLFTLTFLFQEDGS